MNRLLLLSFFITFVLVVSISFAQQCETTIVKSALRKALFDYYQNPSRSQLSINEIKDLLAFYLTITEDQTTVDCNVRGNVTGIKMDKIIDDAKAIISEPKCSDGTVYGECSLTKPKYCYSGELKEACGVCGCPSDKVCQDNKCVTSTTSCTPNWNCTSYSSCNAVYSDTCSTSAAGTQTRTCADLNNCGTTSSKPATSQSCTITRSTTGSVCTTSTGQSGTCSGGVCNTENINVSTPPIQIQQITLNMTQLQYYPKIYGDKIVWQDNRNGEWDIYMYNISSGIETRITLHTAPQEYPDIYGDKIVWQDNRNGNGDIYMYDLTTKQETRITSSPTFDSRPSIYDNIIVWMSANTSNSTWGIYTYDLSTKQETRITSASWTIWFPVIYGDKIVWQDERNDPKDFLQTDIYMYDLTTKQETPLVTYPGEQQEPAIYGDKIVWTQGGVGVRDIYMYDLTTKQETRITYANFSQFWSSIHGTIIAWTDTRSGTDIVSGSSSSDIYIYNLSSKQEIAITKDSRQQIYPDVYDNKIVWQDGGDIYMATIGEEITNVPCTPNWNCTSWSSCSNGVQSRTCSDTNNCGTTSSKPATSQTCITTNTTNTSTTTTTTGGETIQLTRITTNTRNQVSPSISGDLVVWEDYRNGNGDIYMYNISSGIETPLINSTSGQIAPSIYGNKVVWIDLRNNPVGYQKTDWNRFDSNGKGDIYMYDLATKQETRITTGTTVTEYQGPKIQGDKIVWTDVRSGNHDIYMYDLTTKQEKGIAVNSWTEWLPYIYGNKIVWSDERNENTQSTQTAIYMYDTSTGQTTLVADATNRQTNPAMHGNKVVWEDNRDQLNSVFDIYMYDLVTKQETRITNAVRSQSNPSIHNNLIAWDDFRYTDSSTADILVYNISSGITTLVSGKETTTTSYPPDQRTPDVYGNKIVWRDNRNGNWDIYMAVLLTPVTGSSASDMTTRQCSSTPDSYCYAWCSAGAEADCCTQSGKYWLQTPEGYGCYASNYNPGCSPGQACITSSSDKCCPNWCSAGSDVDCCTQKGYYVINVNYSTSCSYGCYSSPNPPGITKCAT